MKGNYGIVSTAIVRVKARDGIMVRVRVRVSVRVCQYEFGQTIT